MKYSVHAIVCFFAIFTLYACRDNAKSIPSVSLASSLPQIAVKVDSLSYSKLSSGIDALCYVSSESEARPSFKIGGIINKIYVREGDRVAKGQPIASLITTEIEAQVYQANEALAKALRDESRVGNLYRDSVATLENYQNAKTALEVAKKNLEIASFHKNQSKIYAPISGVVVKKIINVGEVVGPGMAVCAIMGLNQKDWKVTTALTEREWAAVKKGDRATVTLDAYPNQKWNAIVTDKSLIGGNASGTLDVTLRFLNSPPNLAGGLIGKVSIFQSVNTNIKVIPLSAITKIKANTATVFTVENNKAKKLNIRTGQVIGKYIEVLDGIEGVRTVVTTGAMYLEDGDNIAIQ